MLGLLANAVAQRLRRLAETLLLVILLVLGAQVAAAADTDKAKTGDAAASAADKSRTADAAASGAEKGKAAQTPASAAETGGGTKGAGTEDEKNKTSAPKGKNLIQDVKVVHTTSPGCWLASWFDYKPAPCSTMADRPLQQGDTVIVTVSSADYDAAVKAHDANPVLFLNEVSLGKDATLSAPNTGADTRTLRFELASGTASQTIWSNMYRERGMLGEGDLDVAVGWGDTIVFSKAADGSSVPKVKASVTTGWALLAAVVLSGLLLALYLYCFFKTAVFRDAKPPEFWGKADLLRREVLAKLYPNVNHRLRRFRDIELGANKDKVLEVIKMTYATYEWETNPPTSSLDDLVLAATNGIVPADDSESRTVVAVAVCKKFVGPPKLTFSLARVQMGLWFLFGLGTTMFLWLVFSTFPAMGGSVVALISVSTITAGASSMVDKNSPQFMGYSQGFFQDLLTGPNDDGQPHRFQAVMVNALLLAAGVVYVCQHLGFPTFDSSWLGLLGLSGAAQVAGKQVLEKPKT